MATAAPMQQQQAQPPTQLAIPSVGSVLNKQIVMGGEQRDLPGDEKAAILLLSLGPDFGKPIWAELDI